MAQSEHAYLQKISDEWLQCKSVTRTAMASKTENVVMNTVISETSESLVIEIPDVSGELYSSHFNIRKWSKSHMEHVSDHTGIVLFINPSDSKNTTEFKVKANLLKKLVLDSKELNKKTEEPSVMPTIESSLEENGNADQKKVATSFKAWKAELTSNQVKLVENLQFLNYQRTDVKPVKISVIVSRWDLLEGAIDLTSEIYVETRLPFLYQYLIANDDKYECKFFGVSAQGCNYDDADKKRELLLKDAHLRPRIYESGETKFSHDICVPLCWLLR